ncbi:acetyltransferase [Colletotrichum orchidophilum]|uniref:Acetyltransferase n=1 Tax=Colletotrichum orchidophilum TaxID=1209926 RepID=A0A1G4BJT1_9PEZI|nr:acetyltransferase [Colletotrichum orchidophilum]OHF01699.1 acetyltransferase [Colletotrichum orchidophilum]
MPLKLRAATPADGPALTSVYLSAFHDNPVATTCFPASSQVCREFLAKSFAEEMSDPRFQWLVITDPDHKEDPDLPVACAKWVRPARSNEENVEAPPPMDVWPKEGNPEFADLFFGSIGRKHAEIMGEVRHWYLELLICRTEHQGKGAASPLLRWGVERADEEGKLAFLESMPLAKGIYEKYGFQSLCHLDFMAPSSTVVTQAFMLRKGKAAEDYELVLKRLKAEES